jgi:hypothetical protein
MHREIGGCLCLSETNGHKHHLQNDMRRQSSFQASKLPETKPLSRKAGLIDVEVEMPHWQETKSWARFFLSQIFFVGGFPATP